MPVPVSVSVTVPGPGPGPAAVSVPVIVCRLYVESAPGTTHSTAILPSKHRWAFVEELLAGDEEGVAVAKFLLHCSYLLYASQY